MLNPARLDGKEARAVFQQTATDVDQMKRSSSPNRIDINYAQAALQGINYDKIFVNGSHRRIRPRTTTSRVVLITREPQAGSFKVAYTMNGNRRLRFSGYMENVRSCPKPFLAPPDGISFLAGSGKSILWFVVPLRSPSKMTDVLHRVFQF